MSTVTQQGSAQVQGDLWSAKADDWALLHEHRQVALHTACANALALGPGVSLLDVGCGGGTFLRLAADHGADVTGLDAAPGLAAHAQKRVPGARIEVGDLQFLPFEDESFDVVTGVNSFQYAADPPAALQEARRVLRPGGRLLIVVWGRAEQCDLAMVLGALMSLMPPPPPGTPGPFALAEEGALWGLVERAGFEPLVVADVSTPFEYPDEETYLRGFASAGPCEMIARNAGADALNRTILEAGAPFCNDDGSYHFDNVFRFAVGRKR